MGLNSGFHACQPGTLLRHLLGADLLSTEIKGVCYHAWLDETIELALPPAQALSAFALGTDDWNGEVGKVDPAHRLASSSRHRY